MSPIVVAHRGASAQFAEHTVAAYERAIALGADALECDVRLTADDHLVCVHDATIDRTSNGHVTISGSTLAQLREWDFSAWKDGSEPAPRGEVDPRRSVLELETLLDLATSAGRPVGLSIETKHPTRDSLRLEAALVRSLRRRGLVPAGSTPAPVDEPGAVRMMSFSQRALGRMRDLAPSIPAVFLTDHVPARHLGGTLPAGAVISGPGVSVLHADPGYVGRLHEHGHRVHVWTVDSPADIALCLDLGVEGIISNVPDRALAALGRAGG